MSQDPTEDALSPSTSRKSNGDLTSVEGLKFISETKIIPRSDSATKKGHLHILTDAGQGTWERRWFVLKRPHLHMFAHSNELEECGVISLSGVNVESDPAKEALLGVSLFSARFGQHLTMVQRAFSFTLFTASNSYALAASSAKELQAWTVKLDPTRSLPA